MTITLHADPPVRHPERSKKYGGDAAALDPFCSTTCCRDYHDVPVPESDQGGKAPRSVYA